MPFYMAAALHGKFGILHIRLKVVQHYFELITEKWRITSNW